MQMPGPDRSPTTRDWNTGFLADKPSNLNATDYLDWALPATGLQLCASLASSPLLYIPAQKYFHDKQVSRLTITKMKIEFCAIVYRLLGTLIYIHTYIYQFSTSKSTNMNVSVGQIQIYPVNLRKFSGIIFENILYNIIRSTKA